MSIQTKAGFFDRTLRNLRTGWRAIAGTSYDADAASHRPDLPDNDLPALREQMAACLEGKGGEVSARARAAALGHVYLALDADGRHRFLKLLNDEFGPAGARVENAITAYRIATDPEARQAAETQMRGALEPPRLRLLRQFNDLPDGVKFLVDMRAELLGLVRKDRSLALLENDMRHLLTSWFDIGFLELRRITWDTSSAALLEKLIAYEAVHAIASWDDLQHRLDSDRRWFAYFPPQMPDEPLIFVEVALVNGLAGSVQALLDENAPVQDPQAADTAIFYSISNAQKGLAGISFGNFLIKRVAAQLSQEFPGLKTFATLSPIPGFVSWLNEALGEGTAKLLKPAERKALTEAAGRNGGAKGALKALLSSRAWTEDAALADSLRAPLTRLAAHYLTEQKRGDSGRARDPVAHFHLSNGAIVERLNWLGDKSPNGLKQSAGLMVNYLYNLKRIDDNHEAYTGTAKVAVSPDIKSLL
ncbi:MAG: malonyl-CoA decarboxylase [Rhodospirillaceae bacterium]